MIKELTKRTWSTSHLPQGPPKNRTQQQQQEYRDILDYRRDAHRHILASAHFTKEHGESSTLVAGEANELFGAVRNWLRGRGADSGWLMDRANNEIGVELGKQWPESTIKQLSQKVYKIVKEGSFYLKDGKTLYKNK